MKINLSDFVPWWQKKSSSATKTLRHKENVLLFRDYYLNDSKS